MARLVHGDLPTMLIGGVSALLLQSLHPLAMAGVAEHSSYQRTRWGGCAGRRRSSARPPSARVAEAEARHRPGPAGAPPGQGHRARRAALPADDPELVTFIHVAEMSELPGVVAALRAAGPSHPEECDRYYDEVAPVALALGAELGAALVRRGATATCCGCGPSSTPARRRRRPGTGCCAGVARRPERAGGLRRSCWRPPSASCPAGPAVSSDSPLAGPLDLLVDTAAVTP